MKIINPQRGNFMNSSRMTLSITSFAPPYDTALILMFNILLQTRQMHTASSTGVFLIILGPLMINSVVFIQSVFVFGAQNPPFSPF